METKNLIRQNFISEDVNQNKAQVLSDRYSEIYPNIKVSFIDKYATYGEFDRQYLPANTYSTDHFVDIGQLGIRSQDILINLVDNEGFKKKLDVFCKRNLNRMFAAGVNLFNGQAYYTSNQQTNGYVADHADLLEIFDEVSVHACADTDVAGTDDNPEQLFNGNDVAASVLSNLYQTVLTDIPLYKRINFTTGNNMSVSCGEVNYSNLLYWIGKAVANISTDNGDYIKALKYRDLFGPNLDTHSGRYYNDIYNQHNIYSNFTDFFK